MIKRLFVTLLLVALLLTTFATPVLAGDGKGLKKGDKVVVAVDTVLTYLGENLDGTQNWKATISGAKYLPDLKTPIECWWSYNETKKEWQSGANLYSAIAKDTKVTVTYQGKAMSWQPDIFVGTKKQAPATASARLILEDPINENYFGNTLQWAYPGGITRNLRIIEGVLIEYYIIPGMPSGDIVISPGVTKDIGFDYIRPASAWDADHEPVGITEDKNGVITLALDSLKDAEFPVTIDPDTSFVTSSSDGYVEYYVAQTQGSASYVWGLAHNATTATAVVSTGSLSRAHVRSIGEPTGPTFSFSIRRAAVYFPTSSLPDGCTITAATLKLYAYSKQVEMGAFDTIIQGGMPTRPSDPLVAADYNYTYYSDDYGQLNSGSITTGQYNSWTLTASGRAAITKTATTKFILREEQHDEDNVAPVYYDSEYRDNELYFYTSEAGTGYWPILEVTYTATAVPTITTVAASNIANTTARLNSTIVDDGGGDVAVRFGWGLTSEATIEEYDDWDTVSGTYNTGQHPYLDIGGLEGGGIPYHFRVEGTNDKGPTLGADLEFETASDIYDPSDLRAYPSDTSVSLSWTKGDGSTNSMLRCKIGSYPVDETDGTQAYFGTSASTNHTGLERGKTYYYSVWGESGGEYSDGSSDTMVTTLAAEVGGEGFGVPGEPTRWMAAPDYRNLANLPIIYDAVNGVADKMEMPRETAWMILAIAFATGAGILFYTISKKALVGLVVMTLGLAFGWTIKIVPFWIPMLAAIVVIAILFTQRREAM